MSVFKTLNLRDDFRLHWNTHLSKLGESVIGVICRKYVEGFIQFFLIGCYENCKCYRLF